MVILNGPECTRRSRAPFNREKDTDRFPFLSDCIPLPMRDEPLHLRTHACYAHNRARAIRAWPAHRVRHGRRRALLQQKTRGAAHERKRPHDIRHCEVRMPFLRIGSVSSLVCFSAFWMRFSLLPVQSAGINIARAQHRKGIRCSSNFRTYLGMFASVRAARWKSVRSERAPRGRTTRLCSSSRGCRLLQVRGCVCVFFLCISMSAPV